jgi:hypothetical protein
MKRYKTIKYRVIIKTFQKEWWNNIAQNQRGTVLKAITKQIPTGKHFRQADLVRKKLLKGGSIRVPNP